MATTPKLNAAWHKAHPMPERPTTEQRVAWHIAHQKHCACRSIPPKLAELIAQTQGSKKPPRRHHTARRAGQP